MSDEFAQSVSLANIFGCTNILANSNSRTRNFQVGKNRKISPSERLCSAKCGWLQDLCDGILPKGTPGFWIIL